MSVTPVQIHLSNSRKPELTTSEFLELNLSEIQYLAITKVCCIYGAGHMLVMAFYVWIEQKQIPHLNGY